MTKMKIPSNNVRMRKKNGRSDNSQKRSSAECSRERSHAQNGKSVCIFYTLVQRDREEVERKCFTFEVTTYFYRCQHSALFVCTSLRLPPIRSSNDKHNIIVADFGSSSNGFCVDGCELQKVEANDFIADGNLQTELIKQIELWQMEDFPKRFLFIYTFRSLLPISYR